MIQLRDVEPGESVGYGAAWVAETPARVATLVSGYADGLHRSLSNEALLWSGDIPCPVLGRVSMDLLTVDVTHLDEVPESLDILGPFQSFDDLAAAAGTIGHEMLTSLSHRFRRSYIGTGG
jgi:alanine racemase